MNTKVAQVQGLRRSNAAGTHPSKKRKVKGGRQGAKRSIRQEA